MATRKSKVIPVATPEHICKECRHARLKRGDGLYCHRYPPSFVYDPSSGMTEPRWPEIDSTDSCGEFAAHLSS